MHTLEHMSLHKHNLTNINIKQVTEQLSNMVQHLGPVNVDLEYGRKNIMFFTCLLYNAIYSVATVTRAPCT